MSQKVVFALYQFMVIKTIQMLQLIGLSLSGVLFLYEKFELELKSCNPILFCTNMKYLASVSVDILLLYKEQ